MESANRDLRSGECYPLSAERWELWRVASVSRYGRSGCPDHHLRELAALQKWGRSAAVSRDSQQRWYDLFVPEVHLPCLPWR